MERINYTDDELLDVDNVECIFLDDLMDKVFAKFGEDSTEYKAGTLMLLSYRKLVDLNLELQAPNEDCS